VGTDDSNRRGSTASTIFDLFFSRLECPDRLDFFPAEIGDKPRLVPIASRLGIVTPVKIVAEQEPSGRYTAKWDGSLWAL
jgi:hypothetical protein